MSADGDFIRGMEWALQALQSGIDQELDFEEMVELFKEAAVYVRLSNRERDAWLYGYGVDQAVADRSMEAYKALDRVLKHTTNT